MKSSNWRNLLRHLGVWNGSFTRLSPQGMVIEDMPTTTALCKRMWYRVFVESRAERGTQQKLWFYISAKRCISFKSLENGQSIRQINQYVPVGERPAETRILEYNSLNRGILIFPDGSFSQGSLQFSPISEFGAKLVQLDNATTADGQTRPDFSGLGAVVQCSGKPAGQDG